MSVMWNSATQYNAVSTFELYSGASSGFSKLNAKILRPSKITAAGHIFKVGDCEEFSDLKDMLEFSNATLQGRPFEISECESIEHLVGSQDEPKLHQNDEPSAH